MSVFSSTVTNLVLIYESGTSSASVVYWLILHSWTQLSYDWIIEVPYESESELCYDRRSVGQSVSE
jgi:hypothetical protein